jgi:hypothetical protein
MICRQRVLKLHCYEPEARVFRSHTYKPEAQASGFVRVSQSTRLRVGLVFWKLRKTLLAFTNYF